MSATTSSDPSWSNEILPSKGLCFPHKSLGLYMCPAPPSSLQPMGGVDMWKPQPQSTLSFPHHSPSVQGHQYELHPRCWMTALLGGTRSPTSQPVSQKIDVCPERKHLAKSSGQSEAEQRLQAIPIPLQTPGFSSFPHF